MSAGGLSWRDALLGACLAVTASAGTWRLSGQVPQRIVTDIRAVDVWFEGDLPYVFQSMTNRMDEHHRRTNRHPLFSLASYPPAKILRSAFGMGRVGAVRAVMALVAGLWMLALVALLRLTGCGVFDAGLFSLLALVSAAGLFWLAVPDTWPFGSLTILLAALLVAAGQRHRFSDRWYVAASALTLSMTTTNWMAGLAAAAATGSWRRTLRVSGLALALVLALWGLQRTVFPLTRLLPQRSQTAQFFLEPDSGGPFAITRAFLAHAMIMPAMTEATRGKNPGIRMSVQHSAAGSSGGWGRAGVVLWMALLGLGLLGAVLAWPQQRAVLTMGGLTLSGQFALHQVYGGEETFLYALHWLPLLIVASAFGLRTPWRRLARIAAVLLVLCAGINNSRQFASAVRFAGAHGVPR